MKQGLSIATAAMALLLLVGGALAAGGDSFTPTVDEQKDLTFYSQSNDWFTQHLKGPPEVVDGQHLHPKIQYMLEQERSSWMPGFVREWIFSFASGRDYVRDFVDRRWALFSKVTSPMQSVEDRSIEGRGGPIHIRIYHPMTSGSDPLPVLVYFHGGGWIISSVDAIDRAVRLIANEAKVIVVSVDYRRAPEHAYPAASDDGEDAFLWARKNAVALGSEPDLVSVGGDSAGGHVAINVSQRQLLSGRPAPLYQLLYYPGVALPRKDSSYELFAKGYGLDASFIEYIVPLVFPDAKPDQVPADSLMEPLRAASLKGMPATILSTDGFDILRDSGRAFAQRLKAEGVPVIYLHYPSLIHGFMQLSGIVDDADRAVTESARLFGTSVREAYSAKVKNGDKE